MLTHSFNNTLHSFKKLIARASIPFGRNSRKPILLFNNIGQQLRQRRLTLLDYSHRQLRTNTESHDRITMLHFTLFAILSALAFKTSSAASVFAHFMVQNSYAYDVDQWKTDIEAAQQVGIDGFALNWTPPNCQADESWAIDRIDDAFTAAEDMGFKLMYSFDMSWTDCKVYWNTSFMQDMITKYAGSSATYRWNSNILVSTYGGDQVKHYGNSFFQTLKDNMKYWNNAITLAPALTTYSMAAQTDAKKQASRLISDFSSIDGYFNWQAWPLNVDNNITATPDQAFQAALKNAGKTGPYIMGMFGKG